MKIESWYFTLFAFLPAVWAYGSGPPTSQHPDLCETMLPGHGDTTAVGTTPYAVRLSVDQYKKAETIDVTVYGRNSGDFFRGFFLQARLSNGQSTTAYGSFISTASNDTQFITCGTANSAWGHANRVQKNSVTATWIGPSSDMGNLVFTATVVGLEKENYWTGVVSPEIAFGSATHVKSQALMLSLMALFAYLMRG